MNTAWPFTYNNTEEFLALIEQHGDETGAIVIESVRNFHPDPDFFKTVRETATEKGIVLILDEITAGFRMNIGGAHLRYDIEPDMAVFGKAFSNGYPMAAIIGKQGVMEAAQSSFISSLFWTERTGLAAAIATIEKMQRVDSPSTIVAVGEAVQSNWKHISESSGVPINITGMPALSAFGFQNDHPLESKTYLTQEMLKRGYLATVALYASRAHEGELDGYFCALEEVFNSLASILEKGDSPAAHLEGPVCHSGFKRLT